MKKILPEKRALFLDRDGVIIKYIPYLSKPEQIKIPDGAGIALKEWQNKGYKLIIFTNQSGIARGYFTINEVEKIHEKMFEEYAKFGVIFDAILICPHQPKDNCICRKPSPYLLIEYAKKHNINIQKSFFIGDAPSDLECAINAGCKPILLLTGRGKETAQNLSTYPLKIPIFDNLKKTITIISN